MRFNVKAPYFLVAELAPLMAKRGKGAIVDVSTIVVADYGAAGIEPLWIEQGRHGPFLTKAWRSRYGPSRMCA